MVLRSHLIPETPISLFSTVFQQQKFTLRVLPKSFINNRINLLVTMAVKLLLTSQLADNHASDLRAETSKPTEDLSRRGSAGAGQRARRLIGRKCQVFTFPILVEEEV